MRPTAGAHGLWPGLLVVAVAVAAMAALAIIQLTRAPVTANRSTAATCPPVAAAIVITWPGVAWNVTLADQGLRVPPAARQQ